MVEIVVQVWQNSFLFWTPACFSTEMLRWYFHIERYQVFIEILSDMVQLGSKLMITLPIKKKNAQIRWEIKENVEKVPLLSELILPIQSAIIRGYQATWRAHNNLCQNFFSRRLSFTLLTKSDLNSTLMCCCTLIPIFFFFFQPLFFPYFFIFYFFDKIIEKKKERERI